MPQSAQAKKRVRQNEKAELRNKSLKSEIRTWTKKTQEAISAGNKDEALQCFKFAIKKLDKAAKRNVIHMNTVARKKSALAKLIQSAGIKQ